MRKDFAIFIITHARPTNQLTLNLLLEYGYTGEYYLVLDDQDDVQAYIDLYEPEHIIIFSKEYYFSIADTGLSKQETYQARIETKLADEIPTVCENGDRRLCKRK